MEVSEAKSLLSWLDPDCTNQEWVEIGMALKHEGFDVSVWDDWSSHGSKYKPGECEKRWKSFRENTGSPVTIASVVHRAELAGYNPRKEKKEWENPFADCWLSPQEPAEAPVRKPAIKPLYSKWDPLRELRTYLEALYKSDEHVNYVMASMTDKDGKLKPASAGSMGRTRGQLVEELEATAAKYPDSEQWIDIALGNYNRNAGGWVRFNPIDGKGAANANVTRFTYALVESDNLSLQEQMELYKSLRLPIKLIVYSGGKSLHAIVKVDAKDQRQYAERVLKLFDICQKNGLTIDMQNKNPSRLSRLPGLLRGNQKQYLVSLEMGCSSWEEWMDELMDQELNLPEIESSCDFFEQEIVLKPELIQGVLRRGHKMVIAGPSKAGKSFILMELCGAITGGGKWLGTMSCIQGRVLYINLELDKDSCKKRFQDIYREHGYQHNDMLDVWNLRGVGRNLRDLRKAIIRRADGKNYAAIIIDPIYKVITGSENDASEMAEFCGYMDQIAEGTGCSVIYCHHFSKGSQGHKASMDRASGSGVFARDADAIMGLMQLAMPPQKVSKLWEKMLIAKLEDTLREYDGNRLYDLQQEYGWTEPPKPSEGKEAMEAYYKGRKYASEYGPVLLSALRDTAKLTPSAELGEIIKQCEEQAEIIENATAWRAEYTLREFATHRPVNTYFIGGFHYPDTEGWLADARYYETEQADTERKNQQVSSYEKAKNEKVENITSFIMEAETTPGSGVAQSEIFKAFEGKKGYGSNTIRKLIDDNSDRFIKSTNGKQSIVQVSMSPKVQLLEGWRGEPEVSKSSAFGGLET